MIQIIPEHRLTLVLTNDEQSNDIQTLTSIIQKCAKESKKPGFIKMFSAVERELIELFMEQLGIQEEENKQFQSIPSTLITVRE